jgi:hypothetical protein
MNKTIFVNLLDMKDISKAEKKKARLENQGYTLTYQSNTFTRARFSYFKEG